MNITQDIMFKIKRNLIIHQENKYIIRKASEKTNRQFIHEHISIKGCLNNIFKLKLIFVSEIDTYFNANNHNWCKRDMFLKGLI